MNRTLLAGAAVLALALAGCAGMAAHDDLDAALQSMLKSSFRSQGIATVDRLEQDAGQRACSTGHPLAGADAARLQAEAAAHVKPPADGRYLGDWRQGEKLAQNGRGMTWTDKSAAPSANGANCYNCHQIAKAEISYGTIGPSLYHYAVLRGVHDPNAASARPVVEYTWAKIYDSWAANACSNMPRFGHKGLLDEQQMKHVMALLLDPASPVNAQ